MTRRRAGGFRRQPFSVKPREFNEVQQPAAKDPWGRGSAAFRRRAHDHIRYYECTNAKFCHCGECLMNRVWKLVVLKLTGFFQLFFEK